MKKYGKYEKRPEGVPEKQPKVKSALLQTYFTSLLCMVLCVTMFFGTSYAWFTSEVNNTANEIYIGTLDVGLFAGEKDLSDSNNKLFDSSIRWEPGYTALETIRVENKGDLAFKYVLNFTDGSLAENSTLSIGDVAKYFDVWVYSDSYSKTQGETFEQMTQKDGWTKVGTLADVLAGQAVFSGSMTAEDVNAKDNDGNKIKTAHTYTVALHMKEDAKNIKNEDGINTLMGQSISLNVKLTAYQMTSEPDDLGGQYDKMVATEAELQAAFVNGGTIALATDVKLTEVLTVASDKTVTLDLNGHSISQEKVQTAAYAMIDNKGILTITDSVGTGIISYADTATYSADNNYASNTIRNEGTLNIYGGTIENTSSDNVKEYGYPHAIDCYQGSTTNIYGGTIKSANYDCIRMFCNSTTAATTVNISGGNIVNRVSFQNPSNNQAGYGILNISGGTFTTTEGITANVRLLNFSTDMSNMKATISGGSFDKGVMTRNNANTTIVLSDWLTVTNVTVTEVQ